MNTTLPVRYILDHDIEQGIALAFSANDMTAPESSKEFFRAGSLIGRSALKYTLAEREAETEYKGLYSAAEHETTPEQLERARKVTDAMSEKFQVPSRSFCLAMTDFEDGQRKPVVVFGENLGFPVHSWAQVVSPRHTEKYAIEVDGQKIDTRRGMKRAVYKALVEHKREHKGRTQVDSGRAGLPTPLTLLTGERTLPLPGPFAAPVATTNHTTGEVEFSRDFRHITFVTSISCADAWNTRHFRPAVVIE